MNCKKEIENLISSIDPLDHLEQEEIAFALRWLESGNGIFRTAKPATPDPHLVSYFVLIDQESNQVLLTDHKKSGLWLPPGGHVELDELPFETVKREAKEELGIEPNFLTEHPFFLTITKTVEATPHTDVSLWYLLKARSTTILNFDRQEFNQIQWFNTEEIPFELSDPHMRRFIDKLGKFLTLKSYEISAQEFARNTKALHPEEQGRNFLNLLPGNRILDLGCGPGRDAQIFVERGFQVVGVDFSLQMIEIAKSRVAAQFHVMDMENLDFPPSHFHGVWASASFLHIPKKNILQVFKTLNSLLVEEGIFFLSLKKGSGEGLQSDPRYGDVQKFWSFFEKEEIEGIIKEADFKIVESRISERKSTDQGHPIWITILCKKEKK